MSKPLMQKSIDELTVGDGFKIAALAVLIKFSADVMFTSAEYFARRATFALRRKNAEVARLNEQYRNS